MDYLAGNVQLVIAIFDLLIFLLLMKYILLSLENITIQIKR